MSKWNSDFQAWEPDGINSAAESELLLKHTAGTANTRDKPGITASTLFHSELAEREFSSHVFRVPDLLEWAAAQGLTVDTEPDIRAFEFVQAEALLAAIERKVGNAVTPEQALELVASNPELARHRQASDPISSRWLLGADAHRQWRHLLAQAIERGELRLLDFASKLPIAPQAAAPEPAATDFAMLATREQLIAAFGTFTGMNADWFRNLKDTPALLAARRITGQGGRGHLAEPYFCPFAVMQWLVDGKRKKGRPLSGRKGWELLERHFPMVYASRSIGDPREAD